MHPPWDPPDAKITDTWEGFTSNNAVQHIPQNISTLCHVTETEDILRSQVSQPDI
jgi:hypothetical protein